MFKRASVKFTGMVTGRADEVTEDAQASEKTKILQDGYLLKCAKNTTSTWRRRYVTLSGNYLTYYRDHNSKSDPRGNLLLVDCTVEDATDAVRPFSFFVKTPFEAILVATKSHEDMLKWKSAIDEAIRISKRVLRDYIFTPATGVMGGMKRKFFVYNDGMITKHRDHEQTKLITGSFKLTEATDIDVDQDKPILTLTDGANSLILVFDDAAQRHFSKWRDCVTSYVERLKEEIHTNKAALERARYKPTKTGRAKLVPAHDSLARVDCTLILNGTYLYVIQEEKVTATYFLHFDAIVESSASPESLEVITMTGYLQAYLDTAGECADWVAEIATVLRENYPFEAMLRKAITDCLEEKLYSVEVLEQKPLGLVLTQRGNSILVKEAPNSDDLAVSVGSSIATINDENMCSMDDESAFSRLIGWQAPLKMEFRRATEKNGLLKLKGYLEDDDGALSDAVVSATLKDGHLSLLLWGAPGQQFPSGAAGDGGDPSDRNIVDKAPVEEMEMSILSVHENGYLFCFYVHSSWMQLVLQGEDLQDMIDWLASFHHAITVEQGGGYVREYDAAMISAREERARAKAAFDSCLLLDGVVADGSTSLLKALAAVAAVDEDQSAADLTEALERYELSRSDADAAGLSKLGEAELAAVGSAVESVRLLVKCLRDAEQAIDIGVREVISGGRMKRRNAIKQVQNIKENFLKSGDEILDAEADAYKKLVDLDPESDRPSVLGEETAAADGVVGGEKQLDSPGKSRVGREAVEGAQDSQTSAAAGDEDSVRPAVTPTGPTRSKVNGTSGPTRSSVLNSEDASTRASIITGRAPTEAELGEPATDEEIAKLFAMYARRPNGSAADAEIGLNVMAFSSVWRLVTKEKGNLFKEMQMFTKFTKGGEGVMLEGHFVEGWKTLSIELEAENMERLAKELSSSSSISGGRGASEGNVRSKIAGIGRGTEVPMPTKGAPKRGSVLLNVRRPPGADKLKAKKTLTVDAYASLRRIKVLATGNNVIL